MWKFVSQQAQKRTRSRLRSKDQHCAITPAVIAISGIVFAAPVAIIPAHAGAKPPIDATMPVPEITWRVENPFRFFKDAADTNVHRETWDALTPVERETPVLSAERALANLLPDGWATSLLGKTCWSERYNRHRCEKKRDTYMTPEHHVVRASLSNVEDAAILSCTWSVSSKRGRQRAKAETTSKPCDQPALLKIPYPNGANVEVEIGGRRIASTTMKVIDLLIVGMGDSFGSGDGNPDVPVRFSTERTANYGDKTKNGNLQGYPARVGPWKTIGDKEFVKQNARWIDQACHRSLYSHQLRAALQLAIETPHRAITYVGLACSGAEITAGMFLRYKGNEWVPNPPAYSQIAAAARAQCGSKRTTPRDLPEAYHIRGAIKDLKGGLVLQKCERAHARKIDLLMISAGGNDIGFTRLLANAVMADKTALRSLGGWVGQIHGQGEARAALGTLDERYKSLNRALHNILHIPWKQSDRILLTAYPAMALMEDGISVCPDGRAGMEVAEQFFLSSKRARESQKVADALNVKMKRSARKHGWTFVDDHRKAFVGRGICAGYTSKASFGRYAVSSADDLRIPRKVDGNWVPYSPVRYQPYVSRKRWFRTPNDAFMTGNFHVADSILQKALKFKSLKWFQLLLSATYSGAFHPTAEGQSAIADAVVVKARDVLKKYGQDGG